MPAFQRNILLPSSPVTMKAVYFSDTFVSSYKSADVTTKKTIIDIFSPVLTSDFTY
jgi:hypothetical protein